MAAMFNWLKSKPTDSHTGTKSPVTADKNQGSQANTPAGISTSNAPPALKAPLGTADAVLEAHNAPQRKAAVQAWVATNPDDEELARVAKLLQDKDAGAAKLIKEVLTQHKHEANQTQAWAELQTRAKALLQKPELQAQEAVQLDEAMKTVASGEQAAVPEELIETCERIALRLQHQVTLQSELRTHITHGSAALSEVQQRFSQPIQQAQGAWPALRANVGAASAGLAAAQEHKEWLAMPSKLQTQSLALQGELSAAWERFEAQLAVAIAGVDDAAAPLPEVSVWSHELQVLRGAEQSVSAHAANSEQAQADEAAKAARRASAAAALAEFKLTLTQLERALEQGHTKEAMGQANRLRNLHLNDQPAAVQARAHELLAKTSQLSDWQRWRSDQLREELCVKAEELATQASRHDAASAAQHATQEAEENAILQSGDTQSPNNIERYDDNTNTSISEEAHITSMPESAPAEALHAPASAVADAVEALAPMAAQDQTVSATESATVATTAPDSAQASTETHAAPAPKPEAAKPKKRLSPRVIGDALKALRDEWKLLDKTGDANGILWARFDAACKLAYVPVEAWLAQEKARTQAVEAKRKALLAEIADWTEANASAQFAATAAEGADSAAATTMDPDWRHIGNTLDQFNDRWRNAGHLPEKRYAAMQAEWKTAIDAAAAPLLAARADSKARREALIARSEALCAAPDMHLQNKLRELQTQWTMESKRITLPRHVEQKLWERFRTPQDAAYNAKRAEHEQRVQAQGAVEAGVQAKIDALFAAVDASDEAAIREAGKALEAAWNEYAPEPRREERRDDRRGSARDERGPARDERSHRANPQLLNAQRKAHDAAHKALHSIAMGKRSAALDHLLAAWAARDVSKLPELAHLGLKLNKAQWQGWQQKLGAASSTSEEAKHAALLKLEVALEVESPESAQSAKRALQLSLLASRGREALVASWADQVAQVLASAHEDTAAQRLMACLKKVAS
jgi:Domain of Unknown Function (DUF349)